MTVVETVTGAIIAGLVGIVTVKYELRRMEERDTRQWQNRFNHLVDQLKPLHEKEIEGYRDEYLQKTHKQKIKRIFPMLDEHIAKAPFELSDEFWNDYGFVEQTYNLASQQSPPSDSFTRDAGLLYRKADKLRSYF